MLGNVKYRGLCSTCKNAPGCTFPRDRNKPVLHCEEFDTGELPLTESSAKDRSRPSLSSATKERDSTQFIGLCSTCEKRETCTFPKSEGGVWHCEEYE